MKLLLDTNVFIWCLSAPLKIRSEITSLIQDTEHSIFISTITPWEIAIKKSIGKIDFSFDISATLQEKDFIELPIKQEYTKFIETLPLLHRDPFDRMLIAQALSEDMVIITSDEDIKKYNVPVLMA